MEQLRSWEELIYYKFGADCQGIVAYLGHEPSAADLTSCFDGTSAAVWGNILRGRLASGTYGEIISGIKKYGFKDFVEKYNYFRWFHKGNLKNKSERHLKTKRRAQKRAEEKRIRLPYEEPLF